MSPLAGLICPNQTRVSIEHCLNGCIDRCTPYPLANKIIKNEIDNPHVGDMISMSSIIGCLRKTYLERRHPYYDKYENLWYSARGTWMHSVLEDLAGDPRWIIERRFTIQINGFIISGQIDAYDRINEHLYDYKTSKDKNVAYIMRNGPKEAHLVQVSGYKFFLEEENINVRNISVCYMSMSEIYTSTGFLPYSKQQTLDFILTNGTKLSKSFKEDTPPIIPTPRPIWLCTGYCPVAEICAGI